RRCVVGPGEVEGWSRAGMASWASLHRMALTEGGAWYHPAPRMATTSAAPPTATATPPPGSVDRSSRQDRARLIWPGLLLLGALAMRLVLWNRVVGFEQGDPLEYVNIAYKLAFGIGIEWWDLRPLLLSILYVPVLYVAQWWPDPTGEAMVRALRLVSVL